MKNNCEPALLHRLKMKPGKIAQLADGTRQIAAMDEPIARKISKMEIADGLMLEQVRYQWCLPGSHQRCIRGVLGSIGEYWV